MADKREARGFPYRIPPLWRANVGRVCMRMYAPAMKRGCSAPDDMRVCEPGQAGRSNLKLTPYMLSGYRTEQSCDQRICACTCRSGFCHCGLRKSLIRILDICMRLCRGRLEVGRQPAKLFGRFRPPWVRFPLPALGTYGAT